MLRLCRASLRRRALALLTLSVLAACGPAPNDVRSALPDWLRMTVGEIPFDIISIDVVEATGKGKVYDVYFSAQVRFPEGANPECNPAFPQPKRSVPCYFAPPGGTIEVAGHLLLMRTDQGWKPAD